MLKKLLIASFAVAAASAAFAQQLPATNSAAAAVTAEIKGKKAGHTKEWSSEKAEKAADAFLKATQKFAGPAHKLQAFCEESTSASACAKDPVKAAMATGLYQDALKQTPIKKSEGKKEHHKGVVI
ncbi:MAG: hypothetical protein K0S08_1160 [Gammaproteobacteria bacterium]|jgi:hypothetical protein|nr:hypothetical protein [Gammaproteobacteria bacterium]